MNLTEVDMCIIPSFARMADIVGMTAELLSNDSIVTKTKGEAFSFWLLKLYTLC